jgi:hypothetical protein
MKEGRNSGSRSNRSSFDKEVIFKDINLKDIFIQEELEFLLKEPEFLEGNKITENNIHSLTSTRHNSIDIIKKTNNLNLLFDRTNLILKFLKLSIDKLYSLKENTLAKGLNW